MAAARILIVEDERLIALDLHSHSAPLYID
jgi:hypothetical protein